jgi:hypothetical protein
VHRAGEHRQIRRRHRHLVSIGIENQIVDAASIEVSRRLRHVKTDRLDGDRLLAKLIRHPRKAG